MGECRRTLQPSAHPRLVVAWDRQQQYLDRAVEADAAADRMQDSRLAEQMREIAREWRSMAEKVSKTGPAGLPNPLGFGAA